jgi:hypothetical protein
MRWAEGHTYAVKKHFWGILRSPNITRREKLEFLYYAPYYLQSLFFLVGTSFWMVAETIGKHPWFWSPLFGWCLILSNLLALPLMGLTGLFLEETAMEDFTGIFSFIVLSYVIAPFQAYAALKGLLEKDEGGWVRTFKTGSITDRILQVKIRKLFNWILPARKRQKKVIKKSTSTWRKPPLVAMILLISMSTLIVWMTAAALSKPTGGEVSTSLSLEYLPGTIINMYSTDRILTHPDYTDLDDIHTDQYTITSHSWEMAWNFYLYGSLDQKYKMKGDVVYVLYLRSDIDTEVDIMIKLIEIDEKGKKKYKTSQAFEGILIQDESCQPIILEDENKPRMFRKGSTILVEIWTRLKEEGLGHTVYLDYDSQQTHSRIYFPGIVMPESILPFFLLVGSIPLIVRKIILGKNVWGGQNP